VLLAHLTDFLGISYFDQTIVVWCLTLAMISAVAASSESRADDRKPMYRKEISDGVNTFTPIGARMV
jgi:hypothetical protein